MPETVQAQEQVTSQPAVTQEPVAQTPQVVHIVDDKQEMRKIINPTRQEQIDKFKQILEKSEQTAPPKEETLPNDQPKIETETKPEPKPEQQQTDFSKSFAALSRKERLLLQKEQELKRISDEQTARLKKVSEMESFLEEGKRNPRKVLEHLGWTPDEYAQYIINDEKEVPMRRQTELENRLAAIEKENAQLKQYYSQTEAERNLANYKKRITDHISQNRDKYEACAIEGDDAVNLVFEQVGDHLNKNKENLFEIENGLDIATDLVEQYLRKVRSEEVKKYSSASFVKETISNNGSDNRSPQNSQSWPKETIKRPSITITNEDASRVTSKTVPIVETFEERKRRLGEKYFRTEVEK